MSNISKVYSIGSLCNVVELSLINKAIEKSVENDNEKICLAKHYWGFKLFITFFHPHLYFYLCLISLYLNTKPKIQFPPPLLSMCITLWGSAYLSIPLKRKRKKKDSFLLLFVQRCSAEKSLLVHQGYIFELLHDP